MTALYTFIVFTSDHTRQKDKERERKIRKERQVRVKAPPKLSDWTRIWPASSRHFIGWTVKTQVIILDKKFEFQIWF